MRETVPVPSVLECAGQVVGAELGVDLEDLSLDILRQDASGHSNLNQPVHKHPIEDVAVETISLDVDRVMVSLVIESPRSIVVFRRVGGRDVVGHRKASSDLGDQLMLEHCVGGCRMARIDLPDIPSVRKDRC